MGAGRAESRLKGSGNKDQLGGMGGQKRETRGAIGDPCVRQGALQARKCHDWGLGEE